MLKRHAHPAESTSELVAQIAAAMPTAKDSNSGSGLKNPASMINEALLALVPRDGRVPLNHARTRRAARGLALLADIEGFETRDVELNIRLAAANRIGCRYQRALQLYELCDASGDPDFDSALGRGEALCGLWRNSEALQQNEVALALRPADPAALLQRARILTDLNQLDEALAVCQASLDAGVTGHSARELRAELLAAAGRFPEAIADAEKAHAMAPDEACAVFTHANVLSQCGRPAEAKEVGAAALSLVHESLRSYPEDLRMRGLQIWLVAWFGQLERAIDICTDSLSISSERHEWLYNRGQLYLRQEAGNRALRDFDDAAAIVDNWRIQLGRAQALTAEERWQDSLDAIKSLPEDWKECAPIRAVAIAALGDHDRAIPFYDRQLSAFPTDYTTHYNRAWSLYELGRKSEAMDAFREFLRVHPQPRWGQRWALNDPDLKRLRADPEVRGEFRRLMRSGRSLAGFLADRGLWKTRAHQRG